MRLLRTIGIALAVVLPTHLGAQQAPAGATAQCRDGTYSFSASRRGTCSRHGGVAAWLSSGAAAATPSLSAPAQGNALSPADAKSHVGENATVCGLVASARFAASSRGQPTFLNLDQAYPNQLFTVVIWGSDRANFPEAPDEAYRGKRICVTGKIATYAGTPQIVAKSSSVLRVQE